MAEKSVINKVAKTDNLYELKLTMTRGKVMTIVHALQQSPSPVAADVLLLIAQAIKQAGLKGEDFGLNNVT